MKEHQISFEEYEARFIPTDYMAFLKAAPTAEIQSAFMKHYAKFARGEYKKNHGVSVRWRRQRQDG